MKDVKNIHDIPRIENYLDCMFDLILYEVGDKISIYKYNIDEQSSIIIDLHSEEKLINGQEKLINILMFDDLCFLSWSIILNESQTIESFSYRPLIDDSEKTFLN